MGIKRKTQKKQQISLSPQKGKNKPCDPAHRLLREDGYKSKGKDIKPINRKIWKTKKKSTSEDSADTNREGRTPTVKGKPGGGPRSEKGDRIAEILD